MKPFLLVLLLAAGTSSLLAQPANNEPCGAINIPVEFTGCEPTTVYSYSGATFSSGAPASYCYSGSLNDVWYKFTVPASGKATVRIDGANQGYYFMAVELYSSTSCSNLTLLANAFPCMFTSYAVGGSLQAESEFTNLTPGSTIYLRVFEYFGSLTSGSLKICVSNSGSFADEPCNAGYFPIESADPVGQLCVPTRSFAWTGATLTPAIPNPSCIYSGYYSLIRDVWFKVKVPPSGRLNIAIDGPYFKIACYTASSCSSGFSEISCSGWFGGNSYGSTLAGLTPGSTIYCRVLANSSAVVTDGSVAICIAEGVQIPAVNNGSRVGIGIDSPFAKLDVVGNSIFRDKITAATDIEIRGNLVMQGNIVGKYGTTNISTNTVHNGTFTMKGLLALDSLSFNNRLGNHIALYGGVSSPNQYGFGIQSGLLQIYTDAVGADIAFGYGNSNSFIEGMRVKGNGNVGIGTPSPQAKLDVYGSAYFRGSNNVSHFNFGTAEDTYIRGGKAASKVIINDYGGAGPVFIGSNLGIGVNNPTNPLSFPATLTKKISLYPGSTGDVGLSVAGGDFRLYTDYSGGRISFGFDDFTNGFTSRAYVPAGGTNAMVVQGNLLVNSTTYTSDGRYKKNIQNLQYPLDKIMRLRGVTYEMRADEFPLLHFSSGKQIGLIAQEVENIIPEIVSTNADGYKSVDYAKLVPLLIEAIKEQQKRIEALEKKLGKVE